MACYYTYYKNEEAKKIVREVRQVVSGDLSEIASQIFARLDVIEQAVADPDSEAAASLRKKHGLGKAGKVTPIKGVGKKS